MYVKEDKIQSLIMSLLIELGDADREGVKGTPTRVARFWHEFAAYNDKNLLTEFEFENAPNSDMVIVKGIEDWSMCEHHMLPFSVSVSIGYIPHKKILGISKFARIVRQHCRRLQTQERLMADVAEFIMEHLEPSGVAIVISGKHTCMAMRGIKAREADTITSSFLGVFAHNPAAKQEFLSLIK